VARLGLSGGTPTERPQQAASGHLSPGFDRGIGKVGVDACWRQEGMRIHNVT
jgi:hypothetical protein